MTQSIEDPIRFLRDEHDSVLEMVDRMEIAADDLSGPRRAEALAVLREGLRFLKEEVSAHMGLEEEILYPALAKHLPVQMVMVMLEEHRDISWALARLEHSLGSGRKAKSDQRWSATSVVDLMRRHIDKENNVLFMMASQMLSGDEYKALTDALSAAVATRVHRV
jgi:hemerythrin-like domain-containing protein